MPERSYKYVEDKGNFRIDHFPREFGNPPKSLASENYLKYLENFEKKYTEFVLRPTKFGRIKENDTLDRIVLASYKDTWRLNSTGKGQYFGFQEPSTKNLHQTTLPRIH
jgi:hypothetical protein